jgi:hypothetical protein
MRAGWLGLLVVVGVVACAPVWLPVDDAALVRSKPRSLLVVHIDGERFMGYRDGPFAGGAAAVVAAGMLGRDVFVEHRLVDPARRIGDAVGTSFARRHGIPVGAIVEHPTTTTGRDYEAPRRPVRPAADLMLEIATTSWGFHIPFLGTAVVFYGVKAKLIDARNDRVLAEGVCGNKARREAQLAAKVSFEQLLDDDAAIVKRELALAEAACISDLTTKLLLVPPAPPVAAARPPVTIVDAGAPEASPDAGTAD